MSRDKEARTLWHDRYEHLVTGKPGLLGAVTSRATAHVLRLSIIYALLDKSLVIKKPHLEAALELWRYAADSAAFVFADNLGDPLADTLYAALREVIPNGKTTTELHGVVGRNHSAAQIRSALNGMEGSGLIHHRKVQTGGRPAQHWYAGITKKDEETKKEAV